MRGKRVRNKIEKNNKNDVEKKNLKYNKNIQTDVKGCKVLEANECLGRKVY